MHDGRVSRCEFYFAVPVAAGTRAFHRDGSCGVTRNEPRECGEAVLNRLYPLFLKGNKIASGKKNYAEVISLLLSLQEKPTKQ